MKRRTFVALTSTGTLFSSAAIKPIANLAFQGDRPSEIKAIAFDAFPIFDPRAAFKVVAQQFPDHGEALRKAWFAKIFAYTWLLTSANRYQGFGHVMDEALRFAASALDLELTEPKRNAILQAFTALPVWPDVKPALAKLRSNGIRLAFLSNMSESMQRANARHNGIEDHFEAFISTDRAKAFKPSPKAYQLGLETLGLKKSEIAFAAFAGWDATGAGWFGYPTVWVNRLGFPTETLESPIAKTGKDLHMLANWLDGKHP